MIAFITSHFALCVVGVCILIFAGLAVGYIVGNNVYNHNADEQVKKIIDKLEYQGQVRSSIIDTKRGSWIERSVPRASISTASVM